MVAKIFYKLTFAAALSFASLSAFASQTILDFEDPLPSGLVAQSFGHGAYITSNQLLTDQYINMGVSVLGVTITNHGFGHAASGSNALSPVNLSNNRVDYASPVTYSFFMQNTNGSEAALTDYFSYSADLAGYSGNTVTIAGYALDGSLLGQAQYLESVTFGTPLALTGIGLFHSVTVSQTLHDPIFGSGGIGQDLITFGTLTPVPEPDTSAMLLMGAGVMGFIARRRKNTQA